MPPNALAVVTLGADMGMIRYRKERWGDGVMGRRGDGEKESPTPITYAKASEFKKGYGD